MPLPVKRPRHRRRTKRSPPVSTTSSSISSGANSGDDEGQSLCKSQSGSFCRQRQRRNPGDDGGPLLLRYQPSLFGERLDGLILPPSADGVEPDSVDPPGLPYYGDILEALTRSTFLYDQELRDAVAEYQVHKYQREEVVPYRDPSGVLYMVPRDSLSTDNVAVYSVDDDIPFEEFSKDVKQVKSRKTPVDEFTKLDPEVVEEHDLKRALYRIKATLLLKGMAIDKLDDADLERKYPREVIVENSYFLHYEKHEAFGWYFDAKLCELASLTDYQRLLIFNAFEDQYQDWSCYRTLYNTPETDREYLLYWKEITQKMKWIGDYMYVETSSPEWSNIWRKASYQAIRIATGYKYIHKDLAFLGIEEFAWRARLHAYYLKGLDGVFYEIWKRVIKEENAFTKALKEVYDSKMFVSCERFMKHEQTMSEQFHLCTAGITKEVPESVASGLIAQQVRHKLAIMRGYEHYARKKLNVAELIGLIGKVSA